MHHVAHIHQRHNTGLLPAGDRKLGLGQGEVVLRHRELPHLPGRHRLLLHLPDLPTDARGQHGGPLQIPVDARLVARVGRRLQVRLRLHLLPHVPERHPAGDHQQFALGRLQGSREPVPGRQGSAQLPLTVLRRVRAPGKGFLQGSTENDLPDDLGARRRAQGVGARVEGLRGALHDTDGLLHTALLHTDGLHRELHRHDAELHLAVLLPPEAEAQRHGNEDDSTGLLYHMLGGLVRDHRDLRFGQGVDQGLRDRTAVLMRKVKVVLVFLVVNLTVDY